jgi:hypothetical protein
MLSAQRRSAFVPLAAVVAASCGMNLLDPAAALANGPRQIKFTIQGTVEPRDPVGVPADYPSTLQPGTAITWQFIIQEFSGVANVNPIYTWTQSTSNAVPLFGTSTLSSSIGITGSYNSVNTAPIASDTFEFNNTFANSRYFDFTTGRQISGLFAGSELITNVQIQGGLPGFTVDISKDNIYDFLVNGQTQEQSLYSCNQTTNASCQGIGTVVFDGEIQPVDIAWNSIMVDNLSAVPAPIPSAGLLALFTWSRALRRRIARSS